jgi:NAD(P)-dependent dehydrogenase (short-subunit alcohol dehydrogenase family)
MGSLDGRVALVSGGGRGVGAGISLKLAEAGADIAINYRKDEETARETAAQVRALGRRAELYQASIDSWDQDVEMVEAAVRDFGFVDILVNNAGIASRGLAVADTDPLEMERVVRTHAFGAFYLSKLVLPSMRTRPRGDIIMISSVATLVYGGNGAPYNMGKAALEALAMTLYKEERENGIRVNIVAPGLVETEMGRRLVRATQGVEDIKSMYSYMPFGRVCQPEDIGNMVAFLCTDAANYVTGQRIYVSGGQDGRAGDTRPPE